MKESEDIILCPRHNCRYAILDDTTSLYAVLCPEEFLLSNMRVYRTVCEHCLSPLYIDIQIYFCSNPDCPAWSVANRGGYLEVMYNNKLVMSVHDNCVISNNHIPFAEYVTGSFLDIIINKYGYERNIK